MYFNKYKKYKAKYNSALKQLGNAEYKLDDNFTQSLTLNNPPIQTDKQGLIMGHGIQIPNELCIIPYNIYLRPSSSSFKPGFIFEHSSDRTDFMIHSEDRKEVEFIDDYKGLYKPGSLIPNLLITFPLDWPDNGSFVYSGIITRDIPSRSDSSSPLKWDYRFERETSSPTSENMKNKEIKEIVERIHHEKKLTPLLNPLLKEEWRNSIKDICMKYNNDTIIDKEEIYNNTITINEKVYQGFRLSDILNKISVAIDNNSSLPNTYIARPCRGGDLDVKNLCNPLSLSLINIPHLTREISSFNNPDMNNFKNDLKSIISEIKNNPEQYIKKLEEKCLYSWPADINLYSVYINIDITELEIILKTDTLAMLITLLSVKYINYKQYCDFFKIKNYDIMYFESI